VKLKERIVVWDEQLALHGILRIEVGRYKGASTNTVKAYLRRRPEIKCCHRSGENTWVLSSAS
jgi:hypothetical protein